MDAPGIQISIGKFDADIIDVEAKLRDSRRDSSREFDA
jgi:hypothetical protein